jgi:hypothetical protein
VNALIIISIFLHNNNENTKVCFFLNKKKSFNNETPKKGFLNQSIRK